MMETISIISDFVNKNSAKIYLWLAIFIFGAAYAITRKLTEVGSQHLIDGRNPISLSKTRLQQVPLGILNAFRIAFATIVFFSLVLSLYGSEHFTDVFSPFLWQWMIIYSAVIVVLGQLCWLTELKKCSTSEVSLASSFIPIAGTLAAYIFLGEVPTLAQYIGRFVVLIGILLSQIGIWCQTAFKRNAHTKFSQEMHDDCGFKGV
jgi:drug/metabolite transporter (DMT)-like permease